MYVCEENRKWSRSVIKPPMIVISKLTGDLERLNFKVKCKKFSGGRIDFDHNNRWTLQAVLQLKINFVTTLFTKVNFHCFRPIVVMF